MQLLFVGRLQGLKSNSKPPNAFSLMAMILTFCNCVLLNALTLAQAFRSCVLRNQAVLATV